MNSKYASLYKQACFISISTILDHFKVKHDRTFDYLISCPIPSHIHQSNTPSFKVYKDTNSFYCFGCKASGGPVHLTMHMLGTNSLEKALDYLSANFNLKTKSLAKSFLQISKAIRSNSISISPELITSEKFSKLISFSKQASSFKNYYGFSPQKLATFFDRFYYLKREFIDNIIDRKTFDLQTDALFTDFKNYIHFLEQCQEKVYVIDAESLLNQ